MTAVKRNIPVVDFEGIWSDDPSKRNSTALTLRGALESFGFLYLTNHGIPESLLNDLFDQSRGFFALSQRDKDAVKRREGGSSRHGYEGIGGQSLDEHFADLKELFHAVPHDADADLWPGDPPRFREAVLAFHQAASKAAYKFMCAVALSLGLPEDYFASSHDHAEGSVRMLHYPPVQETVETGQLRAGAHTDFGGITLLFTDVENGLEIQYADGTWLPATAKKGAAIINTGDLMERWTNGQFRSSPHRVVVPQGDAQQRHRFSVAFFYSPNREAVISCLEPCRSSERPPKYPPVTAGEHIKSRVLATRPQEH
ncbi:MAG: isopenicillin N synthase family oxygenase [Deltaproteobacteria bacterium]|nr:isopenicillin N synthase family oxygenase [Deltaproteobacteria bacterium]